MLKYSKPNVLGLLNGKLLFTDFNIKQVFPTPELPTKIILYLLSGGVSF